MAQSFAKPTVSVGDFVGYVGIETPVERQYYQRPVPELVERAIHRQEGHLASNGSLVVYTGKYTGRSPKDRFIVDYPEIHDSIAWGEINQPIAPAAKDRIFKKVREYMKGREVFVHDGLAGADPKYAIRVRFITELASHSLFVHQLFIRPNRDQLSLFEPEFTVICVPGLKLEPMEDGTNSEAAIIVDFQEKLILIAATSYAGEMKKSIFSVMNFLMPEREVFPMHCSANVGKDGRSALFFGLSGTGKTTLSADPDRILIGDDEHGWSPNGIFNFEGGCYAKTIRLSAEDEPEIYQAIRFGSLMENVPLDSEGIPNYDDDSLTENTRVGYPIHFIPNADSRGVAPHPNAVIFLTADAYGVLPPVAKLSPEQAQYHFISGYTSKLAGTERGIKEPQAVFSTCFGAPFMPRPSAVYAKLLMERIKAHKASVYLVNTGWQGGPYGVGNRISIPYTRAIITAILNGSLDEQEFITHPVFNIGVPVACPGVPREILDPRSRWDHPSAYDAAAIQLAGMFINNFKKFTNVDHLVAGGPKLPGENRNPEAVRHGERSRPLVGASGMPSNP